VPQRSYIRPCKRHVRRADLTARFAVVGVEEDVADEQAQVGGPLVSRPRGQRACVDRTSTELERPASWRDAAQCARRVDDFDGARVVRPVL